MMQLVSDRICVLNPPKDNLICDAAKVEEILGVPPERVVDVMALRGDSIDNIPGAPGIGDKGSVELIQRFGSVEGALDHAEEVERKTYRESLQNNRDAILVSKKLVTIDRNVAVDFDPQTMQAQEPDAAAARSLFTELEFNTLVQDFLSESIELGETDYQRSEICGRSEGRHRCWRASRAGCWRSRWNLPAPPAAAGRDGRSRRARERAALAHRRGSASRPRPPSTSESRSPPKPARRCRSRSMTPQRPLPLKEALANAKLAKAVHDLKSATHVSARAGHRARRCAA